MVQRNEADSSNAPFLVAEIPNTGSASTFGNSISNLMAGVRIFRGSRSKLVYSLLGKYFCDATDWRFMNYGFAFDERAGAPDLLEEDETERYCAQLYHAVASQVDMEGQRLLDVGSGRGGGTFHVHRYLKLASTVGLDQASSAVEFCRKTYGGTGGLEFTCGDAMDIPFPEGEFDTVLNVESSHCYPDRQEFFAGVFRTLKPGGHFLYTDFNAPGERAGRELVNVGFDDLIETDITKNVVRGLLLDQKRRVQEIEKRFPVGTRKVARLWAGTPDSWIFRDFKTGAREYIMYRATKPV